MGQIHATAVAIEQQGILIRGPSGSGKSDLALRLIDGGAVLVGDDQIELSREHENLIARCPKTIIGKLEVRGLGVVSVPYIERSKIALVVDLMSPDDIARMPARRTIELCGCPVDVVQVAPFESSAPAKVRIAAAISPTEIER